MSVLLIDIRGKMNQSGVFPYLTVGDAYYGRVTADGGTPFYTYTIIDGSLPAGLSLDNITGEVTGTPTDNMMAAITVRATDLQGMYVDASYVIPGTILIPSSLKIGAWRYKQIAHSDNTDYSSVSFNDSSWASGAAPFGQNSNGGTYDQATSAHNYDSRFSDKYDDASQGATLWETGTRLWVRNRVYISANNVPSLKFIFYMDETITCWFNGIRVLPPTSFGDGGGGGYINVPKSAIVDGTNTLACMCDDEGPWGTPHGEVYFDMLIDPQ